MTSRRLLSSGLLLLLAANLRAIDRQAAEAGAASEANRVGRPGGLVLAAQVPAAQPGTARLGPSTAPFWTDISDAASFQRAMDARVAHAREALDRLLAVKGAHTVDNTLRPYDDVLLELD